MSPKMTLHSPVVLRTQPGGVWANTDTLAVLPFDFSNRPSLEAISFSIRGRLFDRDDAAEGAYDLRFSLHKVETGGSGIGAAITIRGHQITDGRLSAELEFGQVPVDGPLWLEIGARPAGQPGAFATLYPRLDLTPWPRALGLRPMTVMAFTQPERVEP